MAPTGADAMTPRQVATFFRRLAAVIPAPQTELEYQDPIPCWWR